VTTEQTAPRPAPRPVAVYWAEQVEKLKSLDQDGIRVVLWDAESAAQDHEHVAAGILHLPDTGYDLERLAFALRDVLQQATGDPSISVTTCERDDDGAGDAQAWGRRGVAEHYQDSPYEDPWYGERDPEEDEYDEYPDPEDEELVNELASLGATLVGAEDEDPEDDEDAELADAEPSEEEQAALMRESLESAEDVRNYPDGTRFLPSYDQDQA
jgi:hypothetical protein